MNKLLIFDWDGTVMDSTSNIVASIKKTSKEVLDQNYDDLEIKKNYRLEFAASF